MKGRIDRVRILNNNDFKTFEKLCGLTQKGLKKTLAALLRSKYKEVVETPDYLYAVGDIPIALCAHMDTVFPLPAKEVFYDRQKNVIWSPTGLGADDRAGVFAIIQIIKKGLRPHIIFTTDEETGAWGATALGKVDCPFEGLRYIIELDRRGSNDCVFYDCDNPEFTDYIESFGFSEAIGSFSDICMICEDWGIAGVNLSIGYRDEHSTSEVLFVGHMLNTIDKVVSMLSLPANKIPAFKFIPAAYSSNWWYGQWAASHYDNTHCFLCGQEFKNEDMIPVKLRNNLVKNFCIDCIVDNVSWCKICGEAFEPTTNDMGLCNDCRHEFFQEQYRTD